MLDQNGVRRRIIPAEVSGRFRRLRNYVHSILLIIFLVLPWLTINGTQAVWLDVPERRFEFFGQIFLSHDSPLIFFIIVIFALLVMLTTALWGRIWCGWTCPQTVFIDAVYRRIEIWAEGRYIERRRLAEAPLGFEKIKKTGLKWILFTLFSSLFAHSLIAYFAGSRNLVLMMQQDPLQNPGYFFLVSSVTGLLLFNFGWFREQFCIIMCPYGRFQSVLLDAQSTVIAYNEARGEPRKGSPQKPFGDCVSCNRCVQVCPTGIDIRNGLQMECIGCTACVDACDDIMTKIKKPTGLIGYTKTETRAYFRPRVLAYSFLIFLCSTGLAYNLVRHESFSAVILRAADAPYQLMSDNLVMNHFKLHLHNQGRGSEEFSLSSDTNQVSLTQAGEAYTLASGESREVHVFASFPSSLVKKEGRFPFKIRVKEISTGKIKDIESSLVGPRQ